jgi:TolA-binding protein
MKKLNVVATLAALALVASPVYAADEHEGHHPDQEKKDAVTQQQSTAKPEAAGPDMHKHMQQMQEHMRDMQAQMEKMRQTTDPAEREKLMQEHMQTMQEHMKSMGEHMKSMHGSGGGMMMGADQKGRQEITDKRLDMIEKRMDLMQMMREQMMHRRGGGPAKSR